MYLHSSIIGRYLRNESGSTMLIVAGGLVAMVTLLGIGIEMSRYSAAKSAFRNALDQATLAAASLGNASSDADIAYAREYFDTNMRSYPDLEVTQFKVATSPSGTKWTGSAKAKLPLSFSKFMGMGSLTLEHSTEVAWDNGKRSEVVAMMDVSGTMCANFKRTRTSDGKTDIDFLPDRQCEKLNMMREGIKNIVNIGVGYNPESPQSIFYVGVVPFSHKVRVPNPAALPGFITQAEFTSQDGARDYFTNFSDTGDTGAPPFPRVLPLRPINNKNDKDKFARDVDAMFSNDNSEFNRYFMKRSSLGTHISALMLDPRYHNVFGGEKPQPFTDEKTEKVVIMMTDSANIGCCYTNWPSNNFRNHYIYSYNPDHQHLVGNANTPGICTQMREANIQVFTVLLDVDPNDMDERGSEIVNAFEQCASTPAHAFRIALGDEAALKSAYTNIGKALLRLRVVQ